MSKKTRNKKYVKNEVPAPENPVDDKIISKDTRVTVMLSSSLQGYINILNEVSNVISSNKEKYYDDTWLRGLYRVLVHPNNKNPDSFEDVQIRQNIKFMYNAILNIMNAHAKKEELEKSNAILNGTSVGYEKTVELQKQFEIIKNNTVDLIDHFAQMWYILDAMVITQGFDIDEAKKGADIDAIFDNENTSSVFDIMINHINILNEAIYADLRRRMSGEANVAKEEAPATDAVKPVEEVADDWVDEIIEYYEEEPVEIIECGCEDNTECEEEKEEDTVE